MDNDAINDLRPIHRGSGHFGPRHRYAAPVSARTIDEDRAAARKAHAQTLTALFLMERAGTRALETGFNAPALQVAINMARAEIAIAKGALS